MWVREGGCRGAGPGQGPPSPRGVSRHLVQEWDALSASCSSEPLATSCPVTLAPLAHTAAAAWVPAHCPVHGLSSPALSPSGLLTLELQLILS